MPSLQGTPHFPELEEKGERGRKERTEFPLCFTLLLQRSQRHALSHSLCQQVPSEHFLCVRHLLML